MRNQRTPKFPSVTLFLLAAVVAGCASSRDDVTEAQRHFAAGQEEAFAMLQRSGILVVRVVGPVQRPVVQWQPGITLGEIILSAGYLEQRDPSRILIQRGASVLEVNPANLLTGEVVEAEAGDVIRILP